MTPLGRKARPTEGQPNLTAPRRRPRANDLWEDTLGTVRVVARRGDQVTWYRARWPASRGVTREREFVAEGRYIGRAR